MSAQIDWSKAPEGATHRGAINWFKCEGEKVYTFDGANWHPVSWESWQLAPFAKRPIIYSGEWSGTGLPPVGVVCEANFVGGWTEFEMRYYGESYVIFKTRYEVQRTRIDFDTCGVKFRPIRTPEKIAADEREDFARTLTLEMGKDHASAPNAMNQARKMYDLGYRKQPTKQDGE